MKPEILYLHALTPVHAGTGQAVDVIDLPIAREAVTNWPVIPGSSVKGVLRDAVGDDREYVNRVFGEPDAAGVVAFGDQRILLFPVRSFAGTFAWLTCPWALQRLQRDARTIEAPCPVTTPKPEVTDAGDRPGILIPSLSSLLTGEGGPVAIEDYDLEPVTSQAADAIAEELADALFAEQADKKSFTERFGIVSDTVFTFLTETATEVTARVRLDDDLKTVAKGQLWYEEAVPAETVFWGVVRPERGVREEDWTVLKAVSAAQFGGKSSVGRGLCRIVYSRAEA